MNKHYILTLASAVFIALGLTGGAACRTAEEANYNLGAANSNAGDSVVSQPVEETIKQAVPPNFKQPKTYEWASRRIAVTYPNDKWEFLGEREVADDSPEGRAFNTKTSVLSFKPKNADFSAASMIITDYSKRFAPQTGQQNRYSNCNEIFTDVVLEFITMKREDTSYQKLSVDGITGSYISRLNFPNGERATMWISCRPEDKQVLRFAVVTNAENYAKYENDFQQIVSATKFVR